MSAETFLPTVQHFLVVVVGKDGRLNSKLHLENDLEEEDSKLKFNC